MKIDGKAINITTRKDYVDGNIPHDLKVLNINKAKETLTGPHITKLGNRPNRNIADNTKAKSSSDEKIKSIFNAKILP